MANVDARVPKEAAATFPSDYPPSPIGRQGNAGAGFSIHAASGSTRNCVEVNDPSQLDEMPTCRFDALFSLCYFSPIATATPIAMRLSTKSARQRGTVNRTHCS
jgi:hypothetical protein